MSFSVRTRVARTSSSSQIRGRGPRLCALSNETHGRPSRSGVPGVRPIVDAAAMNVGFTRFAPAIVFIDDSDSLPDAGFENPLGRVLVDDRSFHPTVFSDAEMWS